MKTMFVWEYVSGLTNNYHDGGGCLVIADSMEAARSLLISSGAKSGLVGICPDYTASVDAIEDKVIIFPDAGCC
jgi:hypothetical protein